MSKVTVVDYGAGNLLNVVRALTHCGAKVTVTNKPQEIIKAKRLVFPGVGAFGDSMQATENLGLVQPLKDYIASGRLFLGICVGMQMLFETSEEFGNHKGLGVIKGNVIKIPAQAADGLQHKVPHIGWGELKYPDAITSWENTLLDPLDGALDTSMYFVHSYMAVPMQADKWLAEVDYNGVSICAAIRAGNVYGMQCHPEKSGEVGLSVLRHFLTLPVE